MCRNCWRAARRISASAPTASSRSTGASSGVPLRAVMAIFQKDPQVLISHPRRDLNSLADMRGKPILISAATMTSFWPWLKRKFGFQRHARSANTPTIWRRSWSIPTPSRKAISPASPSRSSNRRISRPRFSCSSDYGYPGYANMVLVPQKWIDTNPQGGAGLCRRHPRRLAALSERRSRPGQCADQARQSRHDRRHHRPGASTR